MRIPQRQPTTPFLRYLRRSRHFVGPASAARRRLGSARGPAGSMEAALKRELGTTVLRATGHSGGGCISEGQSYETDSGRVYVKSNAKPELGE